MAKIEINLSTGSLLKKEKIAEESPETYNLGNKQAIDNRPPFTHPNDDIVLSALLESKSTGEQLLITTENFILKNVSLMLPYEMSRIAEAIQALQFALTMDDNDLLHAKIAVLKDISRPCIERIKGIEASDSFVN